MSRLNETIWSKKQEPEQPSIPEGQRLYCMGDIHGRNDLLERLPEAIPEDASSFQGEKTVVYLGENIDRESTRRK